MANGSSDAAREYFPGFTDISEIGRGRWSIVYRARETDPGRAVALRLLTAADPTQLTFVEREAAALRSVSAHPNIVTLHGIARAADGRPVLVLELCRGSIAQWLSESGLPVPDVVTLGIKIASGLDAAHRTGIVHADLSARRILVTSQGEPALSGFGMARLRAPDDIGPHRAPESFDAAFPTPAGDVYSLASTLYELINGRPAFHAPTATALVESIRRDPVPPLTRAGVSPALSALLVSALAKDPAQRPGSAGELAARLTGVQHALAAGVWPAPEAPVDADDGWSPPSFTQTQHAREPEPVAAPPAQPPAQSPAQPEPPPEPSSEPPAVPGPGIEASDWSAPSIVGRHAAPDVAGAEPATDAEEISDATDAEAAEAGRGDAGDAGDIDAGGADAARADSGSAGQFVDAPQSDTRAWLIPPEADVAEASDDVPEDEPDDQPDDQPDDRPDDRPEDNPEDEPHDGADDEPSIELTRRRPLATMSPAFGELPASDDQVPAAPLPDFPPQPEPVPARAADPSAPAAATDPSVVEQPAIEQTDVPVAEQTRRRPTTDELPLPVEPPATESPLAGHTLPGPVERPPEPLVAPAAPVQEVAQGEQVRGHTQPRPDAGESDRTDVAEIAVAAPAREPEPDPEALAAALWATPAPAAPASDGPTAAPDRAATEAPAVDAPAEPVEPGSATAAGTAPAAHPPAVPPVAPPPTALPPHAAPPPAVPPTPPRADPPPVQMPAQPPVPTPEPAPEPAPPPVPPFPPPPEQPGPPAPLPAPRAEPEPSVDQPAAGAARPAREGWDADALAAAIWAPGQGPASAGEESGRYPIAPESEVPTATGPVPTWAFGTAAQSPPAQSASIGDLTLDPASLRRKVTVRSGGTSLTIDETKLVLRNWLRKTEIAWPSVRGFEPRFDGGHGASDGAGAAGRLVAITDSGPVELPATKRSTADLRYLHALLDAYRQRAMSGG